MINALNLDSKIKVTRDEALTLILVSIAMEEIALSDIISVEAEKLKKGLGLAKTIEDLKKVNDEVKNVLETVIKKEMLLQFKLEQTLKFINEKDTKSKEPKPCCCCCDSFNF